MKKIITGITVFLIFTGCIKEKPSDRLLEEPDKNEHLISENALKINKNKNTIRERFSPPEGYEWIEEKPGSFGHFIENFKLKPYGSPILKYDGVPVSSQHLHEAVFDIDTGNKDLQQCADAAIRRLWRFAFDSQKSHHSKHPIHFYVGLCRPG